MKRIPLLLAALATACAVLAGDSSGAASSYPSPLNLRSTASSVTGSWTLDSGSGSSDASTSTVSTDSAVDDGWYVFAPGTSSSTRLGTIPSAPDGTGWLVDPAGGASGFPAGDWTFTVETSIPGATLDAGVAVLTVGIWKGTVSGGAFTPTGTILAPTDDPAAQDLRAGFTSTTSVTYALPAFELAAGETLLVELWRHQVDGISDAVDANRELDLVVNDGTTAISHPAADDTGPTHALAVTGLTGASVFDSGTATLYYAGSSAGSFTVDDALTDTGSGPLQVTYPDPATSGWTHAAETVSTGPDYTSSAYSWTAGATTSPGAQSIVAEDNALQTSTATLTLSNDTTGPTGQSVTLGGGPGFSAASIPLTLDNGTDAGAGVDTSSGVVERATGTPSSGSCSSFGSYSTVTLTSGADTSVSTGNCYRYRYEVSDLLGNQTTSQPSADAIVDATSPTVSVSGVSESSGPGDQFWSSSTHTLWYRPGGSGSFTLSATATDGESGIAQVVFPDLSGTSGWSGSGNTDTSADFTSDTYSWSAGAAAPGAKEVTATNGSGLTATGTVTISADSLGPTGQTIVLNGGPWFTTTSVPLTIGAGTDAASGVDPSGGVVLRASAPLTNGTCGTFGSFDAVTLSGGADTSVASGNCYEYEYKAIDNVGNTSAAASKASDPAKVDTTPPTTPSLLFSGLAGAAASGTIVYYRPTGSGSFTVTAASSDPDSGVASYTFPSISGFTAIGTGASRTYSFTSTPSAPLAPLPVTATSGSGQTSPAAAFTLVPDPTPPTVAVRCNGAACSKKAYARAVTITLKASDGTGSGVAAIRYTTDGTAPSADGANEYSRAFAVKKLTHLKVQAFDKAGNASRLVTVTVKSLADNLVFKAPARAGVKAKARYLQARVSTNFRSSVTATMTGKGLKKAQRWRFVLSTGTSIVQLRLPAKIKRPGAYKVVWAVTSGTKKAKKTTHVTLRKA